MNTNERYELNKNSGSDVKGWCHHGCNDTGAGKNLQKQQVHVQLWLLNGFRQISVQQVVFPV